MLLIIELRNINDHRRSLSEIMNSEFFQNAKDSVPYKLTVKFCVFADSRKGCPYGTRRKNNIFGCGQSASLIPNYALRIPNYLRNADDSVSDKSRYSLTISALYKQKEKAPGRFLPRAFCMINVYQTTRGSAKRMSGKGH